MISQDELVATYEEFLAWKRERKERKFMSSDCHAVEPESAVPVPCNDLLVESETTVPKPEAQVLEMDASVSEYGVPKDISYLRLFLIFLGFGVRAWGGPTVQIDMMRQEMCIERKWIEPDKFNRIYGIYQILPGPEATELACYFGLLAKGRIASVITGLGFVAPGFVLMLILSWVTYTYGSNSPWFKACVAGVIPAVVALVFRGTEKIAQHFLLANNDKQSNVPLLERWYNVWLFVIVIFTCVQSIVHINFFISIGVGAVLSFLAFTNYPCVPRIENQVLQFIVRLLPPVAWIALAVGMFAMFVTLTGGLPSGSLVVNVGSEPTYAGLFVLGLLAGVLTFGGAATAIPFVYNAAVINGRWLTDAQFLTAIALGSIIPSPLVIFVMYVGFVGAQWGGAILITLGMFIPAFCFTLVLHEVIERIFKFKFVLDLVDGITASVVGLLAITAFGLLQQAVVDDYSTALLVMALAASYYFSHKLLVPMIIVTAVIAGLVAYAPK